MKKRILFVVLQISKLTEMEHENIDFNAHKVKQHEAAREAINSANLKISSLSMQIRLSG